MYIVRYTEGNSLFTFDTAEEYAEACELCRKCFLAGHNSVHIVNNQPEHRFVVGGEYPVHAWAAGRLIKGKTIYVIKRTDKTISYTYTVYGVRDFSKPATRVKLEVENGLYGNNEQVKVGPNKKHRVYADEKI